LEENLALDLIQQTRSLGLEGALIHYPHTNLSIYYPGMLCKLLMENHERGLSARINPGLGAQKIFAYRYFLRLPTLLA
jgi:hypothetical protein